MHILHKSKKQYHELANMSLFQNILSSVMKGTRRLNRLGSKSFGKLHNDINKAVDSVMSTSINTEQPF